jgi:hypothetical protein
MAISYHTAFPVFSRESERALCFLSIKHPAKSMKNEEAVFFTTLSV